MKLDPGMRRTVTEQSLGFVATVCPDGTPNVSPKGTVAVWGDEYLVFLDLRSPGTMRNLAANPAVEVNVVDPIVRKGYRFKGVARVVSEGEEYEQILAWYARERGSATDRVRAAVLIHVSDAAPLTSPAYDRGASEDEVAARWREQHLEVDARRREQQPPDA
ncbi:MAG TPA: pyridoxamine 5'-phosphate oxidase family protein [Conexibacter sp.]|nr:pyridoxamine 5'-phosphate oxidase family protein [Conexibacter sp.]